MKKEDPYITLEVFKALLSSVKEFKSLTGKEYKVLDNDGSVMTFIRVSSGKKWEMNIEGVHRAYIKLKEFKTENFKPYVPRTHSPALGLILHLRLLK
jgi:hypothetical protein